MQWLRKTYLSDLTNEEWQFMQSLIPPEKSGGRHRSVEMREIANAISYKFIYGCSWRSLPNDFPPWRTVYEYFTCLKRRDEWLEIEATLRQKIRNENTFTDESTTNYDSIAFKTSRSNS